MRALLYALTLLLLTLTPPALAGQRVMIVNAELELDALGQAQALRWREELPGTLGSDLEQRIRSWQFTPVLANGEPVPATLNLQLELAIEDAGDTMRLLLHSAQTNLHPVRVSAPRYPSRALRAGREGYAVVRVEIDASGRVSHAESIEASHPDFAQAGIDAARHWRYEPLRSNGQPIASELLVPVSFSIRGGGRRQPPIDLSDRFGIILTDDRPGFGMAHGGQILRSDIVGQGGS